MIDKIVFFPYLFTKDCIGAIDGTCKCSSIILMQKDLVIQNVMCVYSSDMQFTFMPASW